MYTPRTPFGWHDSCPLSCSVLVKDVHPPPTWDLVLLERDPKSLDLVYSTWTNGNYQPIIPLREADISMNYKS